MRSDRGQAAVELVALLPLVLTAGLAAATVLAAHAAAEHAGQAAEAGAIALIRGEDPREAARDTLPDGATARATIDVTGRRVTVHVRPRVPLPLLTDALTAEVTAHAGPEPSP